MLALVTCDLTAQPVGDEDQPFVERALADLDPRYVRWDDGDVDWGSFRLVILRSTWDYANRLGEFLDWLHEVSAVVPVLNPPPVVRWNSDKRYLAALAAAGVPIVPTAYVSTDADLPEALAAVTTPEVVVKPTVSAGSELTGRFAVDDPGAIDLVARIRAAGKVAMLQPYQESVGLAGELAVMHLDGRFSHAVRKGPILDGGGRFIGGAYAEELTPVTARDDELAAAERVLAAFAGTGVAGPDPLLYSRVDLVAGADGELLCLELEMIEPSLFFPAVPSAVDRFAAAVRRRVSRPRPTVTGTRRAVPAPPDR